MKLTIKQVLEAASEAYGAPGLMSHVRMWEDGGVSEPPYRHDMVCADTWGHGIATMMIERVVMEDDGTFIEESRADVIQMFAQMQGDIRRVDWAVDALLREEAKSESGQS